MHRISTSVVCFLLESALILLPTPDDPCQIGEVEPAKSSM